MAAHPSELAVLPEHRRIRYADGRTASGQASQAETRHALHAIAQAPRSIAHAGARMTAKLHDDILSQLPEDFIRRMRNWASTVDGTPVSTSKLEQPVDHSRNEQPLPLLIGEADDTHKAVRALPQRYQEVVTIFWTHLARDLRWMATSTPRARLWKLGPASFKDWLENGHARLRTSMQARGER